MLAEIQVQHDVQFAQGANLRWIHRREAGTDFYFVSNQKDQSAEVPVSFRVNGRAPELWHADTGVMEPAPRWEQTADGRTTVLLDLDPVGSVFVVFRAPVEGSGPGLQKRPILRARSMM